MVTALANCEVDPPAGSAGFGSSAGCGGAATGGPALLGFAEVCAAG